MNPRFAQIKSYLSYRWHSVNRHGVHSPFVFDLIEKVFRKQRTEIPSFLTDARKQFLQDDSLLVINDLGAGSHSGATKLRKVKDVARYSLSTEAQCELLFRLVKHLDIKHILEFGTCLGLSALYMQEAGASVVSMEGSEALHQLASSSYTAASSSPDFRLGAFDDILPSILKEMPGLDMAFVDGNHTEEATIQYFHQLLPHVHKDTVLVFDDIHWSAGMERAWAQIRAHEQVTCSLDLHWSGMLFFNPGLSGEHFILRY